MSSRMQSPPGPLLVLALDGASFDVLDPLMEAGRLPHLAAWQREGRAARLPSTQPPMSFPAWSSFATGLPPGEHGIFDFTQKLEGAYGIRFVNASDRRGSSFFSRVSAAGGRALVLGMPATFPPEPLRGLLVAGFDAPVSAGSEPAGASDPALYRSIAARTGDWMEAGLDEAARQEGWHERAAGRLVTRIGRKTDFALEALAQLRAARGGQRPELCVVVFSESDTVAHHFWRDHDPHSPRHDPRAGAERRGALRAVYERLDAACGEIRAAFGGDAPCVVVSDHGSGGAARRVAHLGGRLAECGLLRRTTSPWPGADALARGARDLALGLLPTGAVERIFRRARGAAARLESAARFGGFDWSRSVAFCEDVNTQPGVWINLRGREARGCVAPDDYERVRQEVIDALLDWKLPGGAPVVERARRREEVYAGPRVGRAPDVVVELGLDEGYALSLVQTPWSRLQPGSLHQLADDELAGGRGRGMNGTHRPDGIWIASRGARGLPPPLEQAAGCLLATQGLAPEPPGPRDAAPAVPYSADEEARVAERLRALGYLE